jgi:HK97 family phage major capsid protein
MATNQHPERPRLHRGKCHSTPHSTRRFASPAGDAIIKADLVASVATLEDSGFIRGDGTQYTPLGLRNWALPANVLTASTIVDIPHVDSDLASLELALTTANVRMLRPGWVLSPRTENFLRSVRNPTSGIRAFPEMDAGVLRGKPFAATGNMPTNLGTGAQSEILLADFADVVIGEYPVVIDVAASAIYTDSTGAKINAFQQDQSVIRIISQADIGMRHQESIAVLTGVSY